MAASETIHYRVGYDAVGSMLTYRPDTGQVDTITDLPDGCAFGVDDFGNQCCIRRIAVTREDD